ncbi:class I SAM-dependent methyltransferase [Ectothiorhodospiraceae bacterium 2226]|nr:class I SAM-dependent methyltransferase [Ectothiorhodospiraceae bacterium 2226]
MRASRARKAAHFWSLYNGGQVLDVGVSGNERSPTQNHFLRNFRGRDEDYTGLGIDDLAGVARKHPGKRFVTYSGGRFPFPDGAFDWVFSNAVIEHVGDFEAQRTFLEEMMRVGKNVFFTTPNRWFPIETHTGVPFLHWITPLFDRWYAWRRGRPRAQDLNLLDSRALGTLLEAGGAAEFSLHRGRLLGFTMTFTVICQGRPTLAELPAVPVRAATPLAAVVAEAEEAPRQASGMR